MSFLSVFASIAHAAEAAAALVAPIVQTVDPDVGRLMMGAAQAAIGAEAAITSPGSGQQKAAVVAAQTQASIDVINSILQSQGKRPLPTLTGAVVAQQVGAVVGNLNAIKAAVLAAPAAAPAAPVVIPIAPAAPAIAGAEAEAQVLAAAAPAGSVPGSPE